MDFLKQAPSRGATVPQRWAGVDITRRAMHSLGRQRHLILALCLLALPAAADTTPPTSTLHVPGDYPSIQAAIDAAEDRDLVLVQPGTYREHLRFRGKAITVSGIEPASRVVAAETIIMADSLGPIVSFVDGERANSVLRAFTISGLQREEDGVGLLCEEASPRVVSCIFREHRREGWDWLFGGAAHLIGGGPSFEDCVFQDNELHSSSCSYGAAIAGEGSQVHISDCFFDNNRALWNQTWGGAIWLDGGGVVIRRSRFLGNSARTGSANDPPFAEGGALAAFDAQIEIENSDFDRNWTDASGVMDGAISAGGALYLLRCAAVIRSTSFVNNSITVHEWYTTHNCRGGAIRAYDSHVLVVDSEMRGNRASNAYAGAVSVREGEVELRRCWIRNNSADLTPDGIHVSHGSLVLVNCVVQDHPCALHAGFRGQVEILQSTLVGNGDEPVLWVDTEPSSRRSRILNSILWNGHSHAVWHTSGSLQVAYSDLSQPWPGSGNLNSEPRFVSRGVFPFLLGPNSPCIDAGHPEVEDAISDWHPRWPEGHEDGPRADMGWTGGPLNRDLLSAWWR